MRYDDDRKSVLVRIIELLNFFRGPGDYFRVMLWRPMVNINLGDVNLSPRALSTDEVERLFALGFVLDQVHRNLADLARCVQEWARPVGAKSKLPT